MKNIYKFNFKMVMFLTFSMICISCKSEISSEDLKAYMLAKGDYHQALYKKAEVQARALVSKNRDYYQAELLLAKAMFMQGKYQECLGPLEALCRRYAIYPDAEKWYIRTLLQLGRSEEAVSETNKVLSFDPENIDFLFLAASAYAGSDDLGKRLDFLYQIPAQSEKIARAHLELAKIYCSFLEYDKTLAELDACLLFLKKGDPGREKESMLAEPVRRLRKNVLEKMDSTR